MTIADSTLLQQLQYYGLESIIPDELDFSKDSSCLSDSFLGPEDDTYYDGMNWDDDNLESFPTVMTDESITDLSDLMLWFNLDYLDPEVFLSMNIWDVFNISKNQFELINWNKIPSDEIINFFSIFTTCNLDKPIEKRILYATGEVLTSYKMFTVPDGADYSELVEYQEHILDTHTLESSRELINLLHDYWRFYSDAVEMNHRRELQDEEVFKYELMPKPSHIRDLHNKAFQDHRAMDTERLAENRKQLNEEIKQTSEDKEYRKFLYQDNKYIVKPVESQDDLDYEGKYLEHCVASYGSYMASGSSFIYRIRTVADPDTPFYTAELLPTDNKRTRYKLNQLYTFKDSTEKTDEFRQFVIKWAGEKHISIRCEI